MKPFNIELAKSGHPVCTKDNKEVRILEIDTNNHPPISAYVILDQKYKDKVLCDFYHDGLCAEDSQALHDFDLQMEEEEDKLLRQLQ